MIQIPDILDPSHVLCDLTAASKAEALQRMIDRLAAAGRVRDGAQAHRLLMDRERLMTTAVKPGFAFPHAFSDQFDASFLTIGVFPGGVPFDALDGQPVRYVFLLLGPPGHQSIHLRILARVSRLTAQPGMLEAMNETTGAQDLWNLLVETERRLVAYPYRTVESD